MSRGLASLAVVLALPSTAWAVELKNDGWAEGGNASFQGGFVRDEIGAARFSAPAAGMRLEKVRFFFGFGDGVSEAVTREVAIRVWEDDEDGEPFSWEPGVEIGGLLSFDVTSSDEAMQEVDLTEYGSITVPMTFRVGIMVAHNGFPGLARDDDGTIAAGRNFVFADGLGWLRSSDLGVSGDWIIRAEVAPAGGGSPDAGPEVPDAGAMTLDAAPVGGPDGGDAPDGGAPAACTGNTECPVGYYCGSAGTCTFDCRSQADCPAGQQCGIDGKCQVARGGDCGCRAGAHGSAPGLAGLAAAAALLLRFARRRLG